MTDILEKIIVDQWLWPIDFKEKAINMNRIIDYEFWREIGPILCTQVVHTNIGDNLCMIIGEYLQFYG